MSYLSLEKYDDKDTNSMSIGQYISQQRIKNMNLLLKSHQSAIYFDKHFVVQAVTEPNFNWNIELLIITCTDHEDMPTRATKGKGCKYKVNN